MSTENVLDECFWGILERSRSADSEEGLAACDKAVELLNAFLFSPANVDEATLIRLSETCDSDHALWVDRPLDILPPLVALLENEVSNIYVVIFFNLPPHPCSR